MVRLSHCASQLSGKIGRGSIWNHKSTSLDSTAGIHTYHALLLLLPFSPSPLLPMAPTMSKKMSMSAETRTVLADIPRFVPSQLSTVVKSTHDCRRTLKSRRLYKLVYKPGAWLLRRAPIRKTSPGPQQQQHLIRSLVESYTAKALAVGELELSQELRNDNRFGLADWTLTTVYPALSRKRDIKKTILYFPGGGYHVPLHADQVWFAMHTAHRLNARIVFCPYELAPHTVAMRAFPTLVKVFEAVWTDAVLSQGHHIILMGDSAGGGIAAALPLAISELLPHIATEQTKRYIDGCWPDTLVLFSPALHFPPENNDINDALAKVDFCFTREVIRRLGQSWAKGNKRAQAKWAADRQRYTQEMVNFLHSDDSHPYVSPAAHEVTYEILAQRGIDVVLDAAVEDLLYEGSYTYLNGCDRHGVKVRYLEGLRGVHNYIMFEGFAMDESQEAREYVWDSVEKMCEERNELYGEPHLRRKRNHGTPAQLARIVRKVLQDHPDLIRIGNECEGKASEETRASGDGRTASNGGDGKQSDQNYYGGEYGYYEAPPDKLTALQRGETPVHPVSQNLLSLARATDQSGPRKAFWSLSKSTGRPNTSYC